ncbi:hypothetical protein ACFV80_42715 [Streptomyces sp. NPDC059862]|uniref:hypothetical protein n=1 Tax=Streptomyces sp. NPDC059862 TaxID=3346975 RepID=UPI003664AF77
MDIPTLILLGAAGGLLRGAVDLYTRFVSWQTARRACRQSARQAPRLQEYFDPSTDIVAAVVHTVMGAGAAVLFGTTGQISGEYAALVVGMSAPMLLTQLSRVQAVNEAVTGDRQPADAAEATAEIGVPSAAGAVGVGGADGSGAAEAQGAPEAVAPSARPPRSEPWPAPSADPVQPAALTESPLPPARQMHSPRPPAAVARTPEPTPGEVPADRTQLPDPTRPGDTPFLADPADGTGSGLDGRGAGPRWRQEPAIGEEGL